MNDTLTFGYRTGGPALTSFGYARGTQTYGYDSDGLLTSAAPFAIERSAESGLAAAVTAVGLSLAGEVAKWAADYVEGLDTNGPRLPSGWPARKTYRGLQVTRGGGFVRGGEVHGFVMRTYELASFRCPWGG